MTLEEIVTFCRKHNVLIWKGSAELKSKFEVQSNEGEREVELHFGPPPLEQVKEDDGKPVDNPVGREKRRGKDGRTAAEQVELYNKVLDAEE